MTIQIVWWIKPGFTGVNRLTGQELDIPASESKRHVTRDATNTVCGYRFKDTAQLEIHVNWQEYVTCYKCSSRLLDVELDGYSRAANADDFPLRRNPSADRQLVLNLGLRAK